MKPSAIIDPDQFGVSFSSKQCRNLRLNEAETLQWLINEAGFRRFRLMSYWDELEKQPGIFDFAKLDAQFDMIEAANGTISLCIGVKQPRWPETHWPDWAWQLPKIEREAALLKFIQIVIERYKNRQCLLEYQLENEALLHNFGERIEIDRKRLRREYQLVKRLDPARPIVMSTSNAWGIPLRRPLPDKVGFSYYLVTYKAAAKKYSWSRRKPWFHRLRASLIRLTINRPVFIHELQLEPWGPTAIWKMTPKQQDESMSVQQIKKNLALAAAIGRPPIDLWGAEWWYWRFKQGDPAIWQTIHTEIASNI